ncbi:MAG: hypothetical protein ACI8WT_001357 [Clostridium sp.]|jgi:hypothetical protein
MWSYHKYESTNTRETQIIINLFIKFEEIVLINVKINITPVSLVTM